MIKAKIGDKFPVVIKCFDKINNGDDWNRFRNYGSNGYYGEEIEIKGWSKPYSCYFNTNYHLDCYILGEWEVRQVDDEHYIVGLESSPERVLVHKNCLKPILCKDCCGNFRTMYIVRKGRFSIEEVCEEKGRLCILKRSMNNEEIKKYIFNNECLSDEELYRLIANYEFIKEE